MHSCSGMFFTPPRDHFYGNSRKLSFHFLIITSFPLQPRQNVFFCNSGFVEDARKSATGRAGVHEKRACTRRAGLVFSFFSVRTSGPLRLRFLPNLGRRFDRQRLRPTPRLVQVVRVIHTQYLLATLACHALTSCAHHTLHSVYRLCDPHYTPFSLRHPSTHPPTPFCTGRDNF